MNTSRRPSSGGLRELRASAASSLLSTSSILAPSSLATARRRNPTAAATDRRASYASIPKRTLNLADVRSSNRRTEVVDPFGAGGRWVAKADAILEAKKQPKESRRNRKKRQWLERKEARSKNGSRASNGDYSREPDEQSFWAYLPDVVLEYIFQLLPFNVSDI